MKILQVPFHFFPDAVGGTEVYALALSRCLARAGNEVHIAAPGAAASDYWHEGLPVHRFTTGALEDVSGIYGEGDPLAARQFEEILDRTAPDLVHLHGISPAISLRLLRGVKRRGIPVVLTVHIPGILCARGTMLRYGSEVCDGVVETRKCSRCALHARGMPKAAARLAGGLPPSLGAALAATGHQAGWMTALRMTQLQSLRQSALRSFLGEVDRIVAVCGWIREALVANGVSASKIVLCRHGITQTGARAGAAGPRERNGGSKRIAFLGRLNEAKGVHVLVEAIARSPRLPVQLDIYGIVQETHSDYVARLLAAIAREPRVRLLAPVPNDAVPELLASFDAVAIPSLWMETGPLTVYDAFAAGIPVIGSRRGGIAELVTDERDGLLVDPPDDVRAWSAALERFCSEPGLADRLRRGVTVPRTMNAVAGEMLELCQSLLDPKPEPVL